MTEERPTVGVVGLGRMGDAIGRRLLDRGYRLVVHNRTAARAEALLAAGAEWAASPAEVGRRADIVLTVLFDEAAVRRVYLGEDGLIEGAQPGTLLVEMSTIGAAVARELHGTAAGCGVRLMDVALAGPPAAARAGQLLLLAGGDVDDVRSAAVVLESVGRRIVHLGPTGAGIAMKLVLMHTMGVYFAGLAEALASGRELGLVPEQMLEVILDSHGAPPVLHDRAGALLTELGGQPTPVGFPVDGVRKDLEAVRATASGAGVASPMADTAFATFAAAAAGGFGERDLISVIAYVMGESAAASPVAPGPL